MYDEFADRFVAAVRALRVGSGFEPGVQIGPLIDERAVAKVERHVEEALVEGARLLTGGTRHERGGAFYCPTVLGDVRPTMTVAREETFGPVAPLLRFRDEADVLDLANATEYGLAANVFTRDLARAWRMGDRLEYGTVGINTGVMSSELGPAGGMKQSGLGRGKVPEWASRSSSRPSTSASEPSTRTAVTDVSARTSKDRTARNAAIAAYLGWMFDYYEVFLLTFLLIPISEDFGLTKVESAALLSWQLLALPVGGLLFGMLADRYGRRPILIATILTFALATFARGLAPNYPVLVLLTVIAGIGIGGEYGVGQALVAETAPHQKRGLFSGLVFGGAFPAIMIAALVGGQLTPIIGWRWTFIISGLPALLAFFVRTNTAESEVWEQLNQERKPWRATWRELGRAEFLKPLVLCSAVASIYFFGYYGLATFLPSELVSRGLSFAQASWWVFFIGVGGLAGNLVASFILDQFGRRWTLLALMLIAVVGGLVTALTFDAFVDSLWILVPFFVLFFGANGPTVFGPLFSEVFPTATRSTGVLTALQIGRAFVFVVPFLVVAVSSGSGFIAVVLLSAGLFLLVGFSGWLFPERAAADIRTADASGTDTASVSATPKEQ